MRPEFSKKDQENRRTVVKVGGLTLLSLFLGIPVGFVWATGSPHSPDSPKIDYPQPGWLWSQYQEPLISNGNGPWDLIKAIASDNQLLNDPKSQTGIIQQKFHQLLKNKETASGYPRLGNAFLEIIQLSQKALQERFHKNSLTIPETDAILDVAFVSFAAIYSPHWYSSEITKTFGISHHFRPEDRWLTNFLDHQVPHVYPLDPKTWKGCAQDWEKMGPGVDRTAHWAFHAAESRITLRSPEKAREVPNIVSLWSSFGITKAEKTYRQKDIVGLSHELLESKEAIADQLSGNRNGHQLNNYGLLAPDFPADEAANTLGAFTAIALSGRPSWQKIHEITTFLNSPHINFPPGRSIVTIPS